MAKYAIIRLGKDSVADIKAIDALHASPAVAITFNVKCTQVPQELEAGDYVFVCLGSDNDKGGAIDWIRGIRALGTVTSKTGGPGRNDPWFVGLEIKVVLPESVTRKDMLAKAPVAYYWFANMPVIGVESYANQTVQMIRGTEANQSVEALAYGINSIHPTFKPETLAAYPALAPLFNYLPPDPNGETAAGTGTGTATASGSIDLSKIVEQFLIDSEASSLRVDESAVRRFIASLLTKRFLIATGLAGSGKTKLAQALAAWLTPNVAPDDPFVVGKTYESERVKYVIKKADAVAIEFWNEDGADGVGIKNMVPREVIEEWADYILANNISDTVGAQAISDAVEKTSRFSAYLHRFRPFLKMAAFALISARAKPKPIKCYEIVPVGADWTGNENILGYANGLDDKSYVSKPALDLMITARNNPTVPHVLILDEMNLSHVERYFADILSVIESDEQIHLHRDTERKAHDVVVPKEIELPKNFFIIGTVNVDETTYMFSPKVLDRANVIEFRMEEDEVAAFLANPAKPNMAMFAGKGAAFGELFLTAANSKPPPFQAALQAQYETEMLLFFKVLRGNGAEFGYRVAHEAARFIHFYKVIGSHTDADLAWFSPAFDRLIAQKFLPKLHGSRTKLGPLLKKLWFLCVSDSAARGVNPFDATELAAKSTEKKNEPTLVIPDGAPYKLSAEKIGRMWRLLNDNGFASFAEA